MDQQASGQQVSGQQASGQQASGQQASGQQASGQQTPGQQVSGQQTPGHNWLWMFLIPCIVAGTGVLIWGQLTSHVVVYTIIGDLIIAIGIILAFLQVYQPPKLSRPQFIIFMVVLCIAIIVGTFCTVSAGYNTHSQKVPPSGTRFNSTPNPSHASTPNPSHASTHTPSHVSTPSSTSFPPSTPSPTSIPTSISKQGQQQSLSPEEMLSIDEKITPVYDDPLTSQRHSPLEGWDTKSSNQSFGALCRFNANGYDVSLSNGSTQYGNPSFCQATHPYGDVLIEVTANITDGTAALLFRDQYYNNGGGYYSFQIDPVKQQFKITINGNSFPGTDWKVFPSDVPSGGNNYTLQVIAQGSTFYFFIDKKFVAMASDTTYMQGSIGFVCYNGQGIPNGDAEFSAVSVRNLPG